MRLSFIAITIAVIALAIAMVALQKGSKATPEDDFFKLLTKVKSHEDKIDQLSSPS